MGCDLFWTACAEKCCGVGETSCCPSCCNNWFAVWWRDCTGDCVDEDYHEKKRKREQNKASTSQSTRDSTCFYNSVTNIFDMSLTAVAVFVTAIVMFLLWGFTKAASDDSILHKWLLGIVILCMAVLALWTF